MLKNVVDKDGQEFLPLIEYDNINNKVLKRPFPIGYQNGELKVIRAHDNTIKYLVKDKQQNTHLTLERNKLMTQTLQNGYERFWNYFVELARI